MTQKHSLLAQAVIAAGAIKADTFVGTDLKTAVAGADVIGVATFDAAEGEQLTVDVLGSTTVRAAADVTAYARVEVGDDGGVVPADEGIPVGRALHDALEGELVEVFLFQGASAPAEASVD